MILVLLVKFEQIGLLVLQNNQLLRPLSLFAAEHQENLDQDQGELGARSLSTPPVSVLPRSKTLAEPR